jgi:sugar lactone lactonase YvrE
LAFPECLRWHEDALWFTDNYGRTILRCDVRSGALTEVLSYRDDLAGLGFAPDGRVLFVAQNERRVLSLDDGEVREHADLSALAGHRTTDMIVAADGWAFVDTIEMDSSASSDEGAASPLLQVSPDGGVSIGATDLLRPNGLAITSDGETLVVAESFGFCLTAFSIRDGRLEDRRCFARFEDPGDSRQAIPDGICLDRGGGVWVAQPFSERVIRVEEGGRTTDAVPMPPGQKPWCCVLGGGDRRMLCVASSSTWGREATLKARDGGIFAERVEVPGAGRP